jgi:hypothetical protein
MPNSVLIRGAFWRIPGFKNAISRPNSSESIPIFGSASGRGTESYAAQSVWFAGFRLYGPVNLPSIKGAVHPICREGRTKM